MSSPRTERVANPFHRPAPVAEPAPVVSAPQLAAAPEPRRFREWCGYDEHFVELNRGATNAAWIANEMLARALVGPGEDPGPRRDEIRALTVAERDRLLIDVRRRSIGDHLDLVADCPACGARVEAQVSLAALQVPEQSAPDRVSVTLPDGTPATVRLPTAGDQERLLGSAYTTAAERRTLLLSLLIDRLGDERGPLSPERVHALPTGARAAIERAVEAATPKVDLTFAMSCEGCGHAFSSPMDIAGFFLPS